MKKIIIIIGLMAIIIYDNCFASPITIFENASDHDKKIVKIAPIRTTFFINNKVNDIIIKITYGKNQVKEALIKMGHKFTYHHKEKDLKKVYCTNSIHNEKGTTITESDLHNYAVFVFNTDKIEKFHFIDLKHKEIALKHARNPYNKKLYNEIEEMSIYYI